MMILHDPPLRFAHSDYGIMLPISPSRANRIVAALAENGKLSPNDLIDTAGAVQKLGLPGGPVLQRQDLERVHSKEYCAALYAGAPNGKQALLNAIVAAWELIDEQGRFHRYEPDKAVRPLEELFSKVLAQVSGTYLACRLALVGKFALADGNAWSFAKGETPMRFASGKPNGFCYYLGGGMHHARRDGPAGFCLINDIMIAARKIQAESYAQLIWIVDVDAHKGCGTAELVHFARQRGELAAPDGGGSGQDPRIPQIFNLSVHMAHGWPLDNETLAKARPGLAPLIPADVEILIDSGEEDRYVPELAAGLQKLEEFSNRYAQQFGRSAKPDLVIVVDGADPYEHDGLASSALLKLSLDQCLERDRLIYSYLQKAGIPSAWIMAGGYGDRAWEPVAAFLAGILSE